MAKKLIKTVAGVGAIAVAGKVGYDKYKNVKKQFTQEENDSIDAEIKKYNAIFDKKVVEIEDEEFTGCEVKVIGAKAVIDLGLAVFEKDVYINFTSTASNLTIILPEGVNAASDVEKTFSGVKNLVENVDEEGIHTVYVIGKAVLSNIEIIPVNFYVDDDDDFEDVISKDDEELAEQESVDKADNEEVVDLSKDNSGEDELDIEEVQYICYKLESKDI